MIMTRGFVVLLLFTCFNFVCLVGLLAKVIKNNDSDIVEGVQIWNLFQIFVTKTGLVKNVN